MRRYILAIAVLLAVRVPLSAGAQNPDLLKPISGKWKVMASFTGEQRIAMTIATAALFAALPQGSDSACHDFKMVSDPHLGLGVLGVDGNFHFITPTNIKLVLVARLPEGNAVWGHALSQETLELYFGKCAPIYGPMVAGQAGLVDFTATGQKVKSLGLGPDTGVSELDSLPGAHQAAIRAIAAEFFELDGTDLLVCEDRIYAVDESRNATLLVGAAVQKREKMTGVVRQMADALYEKGATKAKLTRAEFIQGKLQARIEIKGRTKETLTFGAE